MIVPGDSRDGCLTTSWRPKMKKIITAFVAVAALSSSALAHPMHAQRGNQDMPGTDAQAMAPAGTAVYAFGANLGSDPDPQVRLQLLRSAGISNR
jgi:hypothetical protein